jgi:hypothetical protein
MYNAEYISVNHEQYLKVNTPLTQALPVNGPNLTTNTGSLVTLRLDILQNPGQTASLSLMALQDCQQKKNYVINNYKLEYTICYLLLKIISGFFGMH